MKFYYFGGSLEHREQMKHLEDAGFEGVLFTYVPHQGDIFTLMANRINETNKIKYMVAIRPHALSPQYLCMINNTMSKIAPGRLQINLIAGHIKPNEINYGGILGEVNDKSSIPERVNYLIEYIKEIKLIDSCPDYYVSCTNFYLYESAVKNNDKIILPYQDYKNGYFQDKSVFGQTKPGEKIDLSGKRIMIAASPIIRYTQEELDKEFPKDILMHTFNGEPYKDRKKFTTDMEHFTYKEFCDFINKLESEGINEVLFNNHSEEERKIMISFISKYIKEN